MNERREQARTAMLAGVTLVLLVLASLIGSSLASTWARALRASLFDLALVLSTALVLGLPLGFLAGAGTKPAVTALGRGVELVAALPTALFAAAVLGVTHRYYVVGIVLGAVRALEIAWLLRWRLARERESRQLLAQSDVRLPFAVYYRRVLTRALGPALTSASLTPAWLAAVDAAAVLVGLRPLAERLSLGAAAARGELWATPVIVVLTLALYFLARYCAGRLQPEDESHEPLVLALRRRAPADAGSGGVDSGRAPAGDEP